MTERQKVLYKLLAWEALSLILGGIAIHDNSIVDAFISGAIMLSALGDASDQLRDLQDAKR